MNANAALGITGTTEDSSWDFSMDLSLRFCNRYGLNKIGNIAQNWECAKVPSRSGAYRRSFRGEAYAIESDATLEATVTWLWAINNLYSYRASNNVRRAKVARSPSLGYCHLMSDFFLLLKAGFLDGRQTSAGHAQWNLHGTAYAMGQKLLVLVE